MPLTAAFLFPVGVALFPVALTAALDRFVRMIVGSPENGRSPFTVDLARPPGYSVQRTVDRLQTDFAINIAMAFAVPVWFFAMWLVHERLGFASPERYEMLMYPLAGGASATWFIIQALRFSFLLKRARLTLYGKMAAGQELDQLMRAGARVFHDFPGDGFNIDHVIVCPAGVFCIETETREKPQHGRSVEDATAIYDGRAVSYPDGTEDESVRHARDRARWLSDWLVQSTGEVTPVQAVLALPRWVIDRRGQGEVLVINPREAPRLLGRLRQLSDEHMERVAFRLEGLGRGRRVGAAATQ